ncbi:MAG: VRR-NUC domain-containing protein [Pseudomonas sp.]|uniref:VRR-NUC domain-containing protein n=1 Tax=Pseudomonas sp. TaxID=306 RepID=UPI003394068C
MPKPLDPTFYYLDNFHQVLSCIAERYADLLNDEEREFFDGFPLLPLASQALLVRMLMRKGELFRASKLQYAEIGDPQLAAAPLLALNWLDDRPLLSLEQLFGLLRKRELDTLLQPLGRALGKAQSLATLLPDYPVPLPLSDWPVVIEDRVYHLRLRGLEERLRLMFFGNLQQDWSEFVLAELGIFQYERVECPPSSRAFRTRQDLDLYLHLNQCREALRAGACADTLLPQLAGCVSENAWLEQRRAKLLFRIAQSEEKAARLSSALRGYAACAYPGSRWRALRILERLELNEAASHWAEAALGAPENEAEEQLLLRLLPRLQRKLGRRPPARRTGVTVASQLQLCLPKPPDGVYVEHLVRDHLTRPDAPVHYVENALLNSLFGLWCWQVLFSPLPGAFFHPFQRAPADLLSPDFQQRRAEAFNACFEQLDTDAYRQTIRQNYRDKFGLQSAFVAWGLLDEALLERALACIPAPHLKRCFARILLNIGNNRSGLPDLIQFWPELGQYRMIEVKGPGDRLQDNQRRWLDYCAAHGLPVTVCHVRWQADA